MTYSKLELKLQNQNGVAKAYDQLPYFVLAHVNFGRIFIDYFSVFLLIGQKLRSSQ